MTEVQGSKQEQIHNATTARIIQKALTHWLIVVWLFPAPRWSGEILKMTDELKRRGVPVQHRLTRANVAEAVLGMPTEESLLVVPGV